jgi:hypothetical protein
MAVDLCSPTLIWVANLASGKFLGGWSGIRDWRDWSVAGLEDGGINKAKHLPILLKVTAWMMGVRGRKRRFMAVADKMIALFSIYGIEGMKDWLVETVLLFSKSSESPRAKYLT